MKYLSAKEFVSAGFLQEVNRRFFHPLGLDLAAVEGKGADPGEWVIGALADYRDDPEGVLYDWAQFSPAELAEARARADRVDARLVAHYDARRAQGCGRDSVQPIPEPPPGTR